MTTVIGTFTLPDGTPERGTVRLSIASAAVLQDSPPELVTAADVVRELDADGKFSADVVPSDSALWATTEDVPYRVRVRLSGLRDDYLALVPTSSQDVDLTALVVLDGPPDVVAVPGPGVAPGGTIGQALVKASNDDYATTWQTVVPASAFTANTLLFGDSSAALTALSVPASSIVGRGASGEIAALNAAAARTVLGLATTDSPTFAGGAFGGLVVDTYGPDLVTAPGTTQALTGLTIGGVYRVTIPSGTFTGATLDGVPASIANNTTGFIATATSHTIVATGTAPTLIVQQVTRPALPFVGGVSVAGSAVASPTMRLNEAAAPPIVAWPGGQNVALGPGALIRLVSGLTNSAVGRNALTTLQRGSSNVAQGGNALGNLVDGNANTAMGANALLGCLASSNTAFGSQAGRAFTTGAYNTAVGYQAGFTGTTATVSGTVAIGADSAGTPAAVTANDTIALGTPLHSMKCGAVSGETGLWAFGVRKAATVALDTTQHLTVKVDGTVYKLALVN